MKKIAFIIYLMLFACPCSAFVSFSLSGSVDQRQLGYYSQNSTAAKGAIDVDIGAHFRLGLSIDQYNESRKGYKTDTAETVFTPFTSVTTSQSGGFNVTFLFFDYFITPFIFVGYGLYDVVEKETVDGVVEESHVNYPGVQGGLGVEMEISRAFAFKVSMTASQGPEKTPENKAGETQMNSSMQFGISFRP